MLEAKKIAEDTLQDLNVGLSRELIHIDVVTWEQHSAPGISTEPQDLVNSDVNINEIDICIALISSRLGTPTLRYSSGTAEEVERVIANIVSGKRGDVLVYFFNISCSPLDVDLEELKRIQKFKDKIKDMGVTYHVIDELPSFSRKLSHHVKIVLGRLSSNHAMPSVPAMIARSRGEAVGTSEDSEDDLGLFELEEEVAESGALATQLMNALNEAIVDSTEKLQKIVETTERASSKDRREQKKILSEGALIIDEMASRIEELNLQFFSPLHRLAVGTDKLVNDYILDLGSESAERLQLIESVREANESLKELIPSIEGLRDGASRVPRMTADINRAKRRFLAASGSLIDTFMRFESDIDKTLEKSHRKSNVGG